MQEGVAYTVNCFRDKLKYIYSKENIDVSKMVTQTQQHKSVTIGNK